MQIQCCAEYSAKRKCYNKRGKRGHYQGDSGNSNRNSYLADGLFNWAAGGALPVGQQWSSIAYGYNTGNTANGCWVAVANNGSSVAAYSRDNGTTWVQGTALPVAANYQSVAFGAFNGGTFSTIASGSAINSRVAPQQ